MKKHPQPAIFATALLLLSAVPILRASETKPEEIVAKTRATILDPNFKPDGIDKILVEILDVTLTILPKKDYDADFRTRIEWVKGSFAEKQMFSEKIRQYLGLSYKLVSGGASWQVPESLNNNVGDKAGVDDAIKVCARSLESALAEMNAGRNEEAVRELLSFILIIVTPIRA